MHTDPTASISTSRHVTTDIARPAVEVYEYAFDAGNLTEWAIGLANGALTREPDGTLRLDSPMGEVHVEFVPRNDYGVLDHIVTLPDGTAVHNPLRVIPNGESACEVDFTVRRRDDMDDAAFEADITAVAEDLARLRERVLARSQASP